MFEKASRIKLRFSTPKGEITVERLWDLPLKSSTGMSLDALAIQSNKKIKESEEFSFVDEVQKDSVECLRLDILKHIIQVKQAENKAAREASEIKAERQRLLEIIAKKKHEADADLSIDELTKKLEDL